MNDIRLDDKGLRVQKTNWWANKNNIILIVVVSVLVISTITIGVVVYMNANKKPSIKYPICGKWVLYNDSQKIPINVKCIDINTISMPIPMKIDSKKTKMMTDKFKKDKHNSNKFTATIIQKNNLLNIPINIELLYTKTRQEILTINMVVNIYGKKEMSTLQAVRPGAPTLRPVTQPPIDRSSSSSACTIL